MNNAWKHIDISDIHRILLKLTGYALFVKDKKLRGLSLQRQISDYLSEPRHYDIQLLNIIKKHPNLAYLVREVPKFYDCLPFQEQEEEGFWQSIKPGLREFFFRVGFTLLFTGMAIKDDDPYRVTALSTSFILISSLCLSELMIKQKKTVAILASRYEKTIPSDYDTELPWCAHFNAKKNSKRVADLENMPLELVERLPNS